ncbi:MAG: ATP-dependent DNA helicase RecG [Weeksellaceae bacterium]|nr:ATP-dependent DNA helicase RecG [Weeksellaceae bacterium]
MVQPVTDINGLGAEKAKLLAADLGIKTVGDLVQHFPFRYVDRSRTYAVAEIQNTGTEIMLKGVLQPLVETGAGKKKRWASRLRDTTGHIDLVWFKLTQWQLQKLGELSGKEVHIFGKPTLFNRSYSISHPEIIEDEQSASGLMPVYSSTEKLVKRGFNARFWQRIMQDALVRYAPYMEENLSESIRHELGMISYAEALRIIHFPKNQEELHAAQRRLKFNELFFLRLSLHQQKLLNSHGLHSRAFKEVGSYFMDYYNEHLEFDLTGAQKRVIREIRQDLGRDVQMNRLLQGDVGSGKTIVAFLCMLLAVDNGFQSMLMAPTEILAQQHYASLKAEADKIGINIGLLTGSSSAQERRFLHEGLQNGEVHIVIGTHALIEKSVQLERLGLVIIDEQHKFGVAQRAKLWQKADWVPHVLVMTATPIPRTLAMTLYNDLDSSVIDELPAGRKPIATYHKKESNRLEVLGFMRKEITEGRQVYIVYPLIEESEKLDYANLMDGYEMLLREFPRPKYEVSVVHGRMKPADKDAEMKKFASGITQILVGTTVIEVGVNVPNASVMVIENAEKFGLSQLHQLRGRVGRGAEQSYCVLMTPDYINEVAYKRVKTMVESTDGFHIAEVDLEIRGAGDVLGTQQSGMLDFKIADLQQDKELFLQAGKIADALLADDPKLSKPENAPILKFFNRYHKAGVSWSKIS